MELTYHNSAAVLIKENNTKILLDPWFTNGEYFGAWGIYPHMILNRKSLMM